MSKLEDIIEVVKTQAGLTDPDQIALVSRIVANAMSLAARAAAGENVDEDMAVVRATALNLSEHARNVLGRNILLFVQETVSQVLTRVLIA